MTLPRPRRNAQLKCKVRTLTYSFDRRCGSLYLPALHCCDMGGAIDLFSAIDPEVTEIHVYAGQQADVVYQKHAGDASDWCALRPSVAKRRLSR